ncbi:MAG: hypothetical protein N5P05_002688 [Chroococcopsis gigantea SAG 12.99]|jgi:hypothetical protein|nr:hypothetical protein [Chlorogloea purpurea SAG 13.99]MDV3001082.1 hypothetical protein [Chroococcopsis gigantea SAG 12.99]
MSSSIPVTLLIRLLVALTRRNLPQAADAVRKYLIVKALLTPTEIAEEEKALLADPSADLSDEELKRQYEEFKKLISPFGGTVPFI